MKKYLLAICFGALSFSVHAEPLPLIDVHAHFESLPFKDFAASSKSALASMDRLGIAQSLLMPPPRATLNEKTNYDIEELRDAVKANSDRFALLGGGGSLGFMLHNTPANAVSEEVRTSFRKRAEALVALGAVGFGEIPIEHFSLPNMGPRHAYSVVDADHPLLFLLADIAADKEVPIDVHFDLVPDDMPLPDILKSPPNPRQLKGNLPAFERLLAHNPRARIVWSHVGHEPIQTRGPTVVRRMLQAYPNLYMSFRINRGGPPPTMAMSREGALKPGWLQLIQDFPDRFMLGSDSFYAREGVKQRGSTEEGMNNLRSLVEQLPEAVGRKVASENAIHVYRLKSASLR